MHTAATTKQFPVTVVTHKENIRMASKGCLHWISLGSNVGMDVKLVVISVKTCVRVMFESKVELVSGVVKFRPFSINSNALKSDVQKTRMFWSK